MALIPLAGRLHLSSIEFGDGSQSESDLQKKARPVFGTSHLTDLAIGKTPLSNDKKFAHLCSKDYFKLH